MSRILCVCEHGNNRSVTLAHQLKYLGHDCIPVGTRTNTPETLNMLACWADHVIFTDSTQSIEKLSPENQGKCRLFDVGMDVFPRPFNKVLLRVLRKFVDEHRASL